MLIDKTVDFDQLNVVRFGLKDAKKGKNNVHQ